MRKLLEAMVKVRGRGRIKEESETSPVRWRAGHLNIDTLTAEDFIAIEKEMDERGESFIKKNMVDSLERLSRILGGDFAPGLRQRFRSGS
jgi:hypothetical protein